MTTALDAADAIVYDLDGTLLELAVDWDAVADDVVGAYAERALIAPTDDLWSLLDAAADYDIEAVVHETIADHERAGARESTLLPLGERLAADIDADRPAAVCSLNCEEACRIALETHDLEEAVDAVVGRDTVETHKPEPESLLAAVEALGGEPERAVFVGDSESDRVTADRAGVPFVSVVEALGE
ncbi:HAD family hydrolase [Halorubrum aethiopicum]|uniref:HAD family hydrolase n=1 Tax=Halorubrum aethiopicum TaxID=1758255 RepID=UPI0008371022|nr:HAD-IA family hydrolase [Halorubrum aethiopicum]